MGLNGRTRGLEGIIGRRLHRRRYLADPQPPGLPQLRIRQSLYEPGKLREKTYLLGLWQRPGGRPDRFHETGRLTLVCAGLVQQGTGTHRQIGLPGQGRQRGKDAKHKDNQETHTHHPNGCAMNLG